MKEWLTQIDQVGAGGAKGIDGFCYTTWENKFDDLEAVAALIKSRGRWGTGSPFLSR